jgi:hypothetical protein
MMRLTILVLAFGLAFADYLPSTAPAEATTPCEETTPGSNAGVTTPGAATTAAGYGATTPGSIGGGVTTGAGYGATTPGSVAGATTPISVGGVTTPAGSGSGTATTPGASKSGHSHFKCNRKPTGGQNILNLDPVLSVENLCADVCKNSTCGNQGQPGLLGPAECLLNSAGSVLSPFQSCLIPCILNLNVLETCNAAVIASTLAKLCPDFKKQAVCASVCACCALEDDPLLNVCINACVSDKGLDVSILAPGVLPPVNVPVKLPVSL